MTLCELNLTELEQLHATMLHAHFPPMELKPFAAMKTLVERGIYHPLGAYEGEALIGYALLWESPDTAYVLVDYLGVSDDRRGQGLGSEILRLLALRFPHHDGILVESEAPEGGPEDGLRYRRMDFYRRAGYTYLNYECVLFGVRYTVCLRSPNGRGTETGALAAHQALYHSQFSDAAYRKFIQIPRDPDHPLAPPESWAEQKNLPGLEEGGEGG